MTPPSVRLEPFGAAHLDDLSAILADEEIVRFTDFPDRMGAAFAPAWLSGYQEGRAAGTCEAFAALGEDGRFLGVGLAPAIDGEAHEVELGYIVVPGARGRGVGTEILHQLTEWAFTTLDARRLVLLIDVENGASATVAERVGFVREGVLRSRHLKGGRRIDQAIWSRLPSDPAPAA
jgi:RimJ/RimL family protein N-acetyltransferase